VGSIQSTNTLCGQNVELCDVRPDGVYSIHRTLRLILSLLSSYSLGACYYHYSLPVIIITFVINIYMDAAQPACLIFISHSSIKYAVHVLPVMRR
jgi:biotin transporter BioY